jgi:hypothetical protein
MRKPPLMPTAQHQVAPSILLVGPGNPHEALCRECAQHAAGAKLETCSMANLTTRAAELRPLAIIVPSEILAFDPSEFQALARTVNAALIPLRADLPADEIGDGLIGALFEAASRRVP